MLAENKTAVAGTEEIVLRLEVLYGPGIVWQLEQLSPRIFRAWLTDGRCVMVTLLDNGMMAFRPVEGDA